MKTTPSLFSTALILAFLATPVAGADPFKAQVYGSGGPGEQEKLLFNLVRNDAGTPSSLTTTSEFDYPDGQVAAREQATLENGKVKSYRLEQLQLNENGTLEVRDGIAYFTYTRGGKTKTDQEKATDNLIVGPNTIEFIQAHWPAILEGKDVDARFAVLERMETVGFKFFKIDERRSGDKDLVRVKMKPTSFLIAALVDPLIFTFDKKSTRLVEMKGRTLPKLKVKDKWKDVDAHITYEYAAK